jgi:hypothetical protein
MTTLFLTPADDFVYTTTITDEDGAAYDLSGSTLWFTVKRRKSDADADAVAKLYWVSGGSADGISVASEESGEAAIRLTPTETDDFAYDAHYWDLQLQDAAGVIHTVDEGILIVRRSVTGRTTTP